MKILKLRFKNLNSLTGEWCIDFSDTEYISNGIFAIIGPTGSGKSTILDAVSLALYGRTPRLDRVNSNSNEIMSRHTGECFSEVIFETNSGRFRCNWSQRRSRNKPDGNLQAAKHEFVDDSDGIILENKLSRVADVVEKKTGMDFDRFTRSILLAQGSFAAFLKASPDERSPILEQITGTGIYSEISIEVHNRNAEEKKKLEILKAAMNNVQILTVEDEKQYGELIQGKTEEQAGIIKNQKQLNDSLQWLGNIEKLETEIGSLDKNWQNHLLDKEYFTPSLEKLIKAQKALNINSDYNLLSSLRTQQKNDTGKLKKLETDLPILVSEMNEAEIKSNLSEESLKAFEELFKTEIEKIKTVRVLDIKIDEQHKILRGLNEEIDNIIKNINDSNSGIKDNTKKINSINADLDKLKQFFENNSADAALLSEFTAIEQMFSTLADNLKSKNEAIVLKDKANGEFERSVKTLTVADKTFETSKKEFEKSESEYEIIERKLQKELRGTGLSDFREKLDELKTIGQQYKDIEKILSDIKKVEKEIAAKKMFKAEDEKKTDPLESIICTAKIEIDKLEIQIDASEVQVKLQNRINDLEKQRKLLEDGKECPLCGSIHHPFADGNVPVISDIEEHLKKLKTKYKSQIKSLESNKVELGRLQALIEGYGKSIFQHEKGFKALLKDYAEIAGELNVTLGHNELTSSLPQIKSKLQDQINAISSKIKILESYEKQKSQLFDAKSKKEKNLYKKETEFNKAAHNKETAETAFSDTVKGLAKTEKQYKDYRLEILDRLSKFGEFTISEEKPDGIIKELKLRKNRWFENIEREISLNAQQSRLNVTIEGLNSKLSELNKNLSEKEDKKMKQSSVIYTYKEDRNSLFGMKKTDEEENKLTKQLKLLRTELDNISKKLNTALNNAALQENQIKQVRIAVNERAGELLKSESDFTKSLEDNGFKDENIFILAILPGEKLEKLAKEHTDIINKETELKTLIKSNQDQLHKELSRKLTDETTEDLNSKLDKVNTQAKEILENIVTLKTKLTENKERKELLAGKVQQFDQQKKECGKWGRLHELIGSVDGKKFRNFAQGITFDLMVNHANKKLLGMTDRYLLQRDNKQPLELNVVDDYQGGEIRTVKNLSGGESFIVSLALALGLSNMSSRNVRVDSLFLDEGFGTLDEDALETALETLGSLQQEGKLIGVISHIAALKERIPAQIQVTPKSGGRSEISGPGCMKI